MGDGLLLMGMVSVLCVAAVVTAAELYALKRLVQRLTTETELHRQMTGARLKVLDDKMNDLRVRNRWDGI